MTKYSEPIKTPAPRFSDFQSVKTDARCAINLRNTNAFLPANLWAAHVWERTGIPTAYICKIAGRNSGWAIGSMNGALYLPCYEIAAKNGEWMQAYPDMMLGLIELLANDTERQGAWNFAHGIYNDVEEAPMPIRKALHNFGVAVGGMAAPVQHSARFAQEEPIANREPMPGMSEFRKRFEAGLDVSAF